MNLGTEILTIPTAQIHKDDVFNCRPRSEITNDNEIPAMGKEFEAGKQIAPVIVWNREDVQKNAPELIKGMGRRGEDFIIILDINAIFSSDALELVKQNAEQAEEVALR